MYGVIDISIVPVRLLEAESSEMVTQLLFGELYKVVTIKERWMEISSLKDSYCGWIDRKLFVECSEIFVKTATENRYISIDELVKVSEIGVDGVITVVKGSSIPIYSIKDNKFYIADRCFELLSSSDGITSWKGRSLLEMINFAKGYLNTPYLWGGRTNFGIDCSGFAQCCYDFLGLSIDRDASQQEKLGVTVDGIGSAIAGDLAFFCNEKGMINHVGIIIGDGLIIHASGKVRIDCVDRCGIYPATLLQGKPIDGSCFSGVRTHSIKSIKRLV